MALKHHLLHRVYISNSKSLLPTLFSLGLVLDHSQSNILLPLHVLKSLHVTNHFLRYSWPPDMLGILSRQPPIRENLSIVATNKPAVNHLSSGQWIWEAKICWQRYEYTIHYTSALSSPFCNHHRWFSSSLVPPFLLNFLCKKWGVRSEEWGVRSEEWGVRSEEWGVRSEEWGVRSEEWGVRSEEWGVRSEEWGVRSEEW